MSKRCPYCCSYNTEHRVTGILGYTAVQGMRFATAAVAALTVGVVNKTAGHGAGHTVIHNTKTWGEDIHRHDCCNCKRSFK